MDERTLSKITMAKKAHRFLVYIFLVLLAAIILQFVTIGSEGFLGGMWGAGRSASSDPSSQGSLRSIAKCMRISSETIALAKCLQEVLSDSLGSTSSLVLRNSTPGARDDRSKEEENYARATENEQRYARATKELGDLRSKFEIMRQHLQHSVIMMELKDLSLSDATGTERTWFMSSLRGTPVDGKPEEFWFPSTISKGRLLCLQGSHRHNGTMNKYGFAWKGFLPEGSTYLPGLTLVAENDWDYLNPWHSMSTLINFAAWRAENGCKVPARLIIYHMGEIRDKIGDWITNVLHASLGAKLTPDDLSSYGSGPVCLEDAVVHRRGLGGMSSERMHKLFAMVRCQVLKFCNVAPRSYFLGNKDGKIDITLVARSGPREFRNLTGVIDAVSKQCRMIEECTLHVVSISNLSFCQQVEVMSKTDILVTTHGAQLTNMMFMPRGGSVMELYPKGWLEFAGQGQYIYTWLANWSGLKHEGSWRDPDGPDCPYDPKTRELDCFLFFKDRLVGLNSTHLSLWTAKVLKELQTRKRENSVSQGLETSSCSRCD